MVYQIDGTVARPPRARAARRGLSIAAAAACCLAVTLLPTAGTAGTARGLPRTWPLPNASRASTRLDPVSPIDAANVGRLRVLWRFRFSHSAVHDPTGSPEALRGIVATPIVARGTVFVQDSTSSVFALARGSGALRWVHRFRAPNYGRNGLAFSSGSLYGSTDTTVFALSAKTGRLIWQQRLVTPAEQYVDIAPMVANNLVYVATVGYPPGGRGALYALDAHDGSVRWRFSTIRGPWPHPAVAGGGGAWYTPSVDGAGDVYWGVANPYPVGGSRALPNGRAYAGPALYTDSLVVLAGKTGRLLWYDQVTSHDVRDYDFQLPPVLARAAVAGKQRDVVFGGGKAGIVIAWDRTTHRRLWESRVGLHLNDAGPLGPRTVRICPGFFGGVETPMAYAPGRLYVPVVNLCTHGSAYGYQPIDALDPVRGTGEFVALDPADGTVSWRRVLPQPDFGCATAADGVVFTSTIDGRLYAFAAADGTTLWQARAPAGVNGCPALSGRMLIVPAGSGTTRLRHPKYELVAYGLPPARPTR